MSADNMPRNVVGFVGLGSMGNPIATRIAMSGLGVIGFDRDTTTTDSAAEKSSLSPASSLSDLSGLDRVVCMLPDSDAVDTVVRGRGGLLEILPIGSHILDMGSSTPSRTVKLARVCEDRGISLVDAPVSGGVSRALTGELTVMFGGPQPLLDRWIDVLRPISTRVVRMGGLGSGHAMKALNNVMSAVGLTIACEVIEVGRAFGLDPQAMLDVLNQSTGRNHATETKVGQFVLTGQYTSGFLYSLMVKDLKNAAQLSREMHSVTPLTDACLELWDHGTEKLPPDADQTMISRVIAGFESS